MCAKCERLEEEVAYLKSELGQVTDATLLGHLRVLYGIRPQAARIIERLYRARPKVLNQMRLAEALSGEGDSDRLVDVFVMHARKVLGHDAIITHRSFGYSIGPAGAAAMDAAIEASAHGTKERAA